MALDEAFQLIQQGNEAVDSWQASKLFDAASEKLHALSLQTEIPHDDDEQQKIAILYKQQAKEYFFKARTSLLTALTDENFNDQQQREHLFSETDIDANSLVTTNPMAHSLTLSDKQARDRLDLFGRLFANIPDLEAFRKGHESRPINNQSTAPVALLSETALEQRLAQLNENLPIQAQTMQQRLLSINKGLGRLGVNIPVEQKLSVKLPMSHDEQVDEIIQQTKDEVLFMRPSDYTPLMGSAPPSDDNVGVDTLFDSDSDMDSDDSDSDASTDTSELSMERIVLIRETVAEAQSQLAQLQALLGGNEGGEVDLDEPAGKHALRQARQCLVSAAHAWEPKKFAKLKAKREKQKQRATK
jgi:hypothetical protein